MFKCDNNILRAKIRNFMGSHKYKEAVITEHAFSTLSQKYYNKATFIIK